MWVIIGVGIYVNDNSIVYSWIFFFLLLLLVFLNMFMGYEVVWFDIMLMFFVDGFKIYDNSIN